eukprot:m.177001 g.177001  ORF g.177001 m.177001 type:complete len:330 (+) comp31868_c0_seq2:142-1131(+)
MLKVAASALLAIVANANAECADPVGYHFRGVEEYCDADSRFTCTQVAVPGCVRGPCKTWECGGESIKPLFDDRARDCNKGKQNEQLRLAIGNHMFGQKTSGVDCSAWCLYDVVDGPATKVWRWNNKGSKQCWDLKPAYQGCKDSADMEKTNAIASFDALCPLGATIKADPTCPFARLIDHSGDTCWNKLGSETDGFLPRIWRTGPNPENVPDHHSFFLWTKNYGNGHDNTQAGFEAFIAQDPNAFAYTRYVKNGGSFMTYIVWTTDTSNPMYQAYADTYMGGAGIYTLRLHGSASGICDFETATPFTATGDTFAGVESFALTNECATTT